VLGQSRAALVILSAGLLTFGVVFTLLQVTRSAAAPSQVVVEPSPTLTQLVRATDSIATQLVDGQTAIGVPISGSEPLLRDVQPGDRLDVVASLPSPVDGRPVTGVIVRGATVLRQATSSDPLLLEVSPDDAMALAHLVLGGAHLGYTVWPSNGGTPTEPRPLDERAVRAALGLSAVATVVPTPTPAPTETIPPAAAATPVPIRGAGFLYQAQPGDTWESVAATFSLSAALLRQWNEAPADAGLGPGTLLFIPRTP
jgi:LysM domain